MLLTVVNWLLFYFISSILGYGFFQFSSSKRSVSFSLTDAVLAGITVTVIISQLLSIFFPANFWLIIGLALPAFWLNWRLANQPVMTALSALRRAGRQPLLWLLTGVVLLFAVRTATNPDSGIYHIPAIRWYEQFRVVPGLGNLHGRLAFNSAFFVLSAVFGFTSPLGQTLFSLNSFLFLLFGFFVIRRLNQPERQPGSQLLAVLLLGLALYYLLYQVSSPTPDLWATLLPLFIVLRWLDEPVTRQPAQRVLTAALVWLCLVVKLGAVIMLLFLPFLLWPYRRSIRWKQLTGLLALSGLFIVPWLVRNIILSGYLVYPFPALDLFAVDWKIPLAAVHYEEDYITFWARFHRSEPYLDFAMLKWPFSQWFPFWWHSQGQPETIGYYGLNRLLFVAAALSPLVMLAMWLWRRAYTSQVGVAYLVALAGGVFWFVKAPEFRFGYAYLWLMVLLPWLPLFAHLQNLLAARWLQIGLASLLFWFGAKLIYQESRAGAEPANRLMARTLLIPNWYGYRNQLAEGFPHKAFRTRSGLLVLVPTPIAAEQRCYDQRFPCSPYLFNDLEQRGPSLENGFRRRPQLPLSSVSVKPSINEVQRYYPGLQ